MGVHDRPIEGVDDFVLVEVTEEDVGDRNGDGSGGGAVPCRVGGRGSESVGAVRYSLGVPGAGIWGGG